MGDVEGSQGSNQLGQAGPAHDLRHRGEKLMTLDVGVSAWEAHSFLLGRRGISGRRLLPGFRRRRFRWGVGHPSTVQAR